MPMLKKLFQTENSWSFLTLRILLALVIFPHGAQKLFGWFGGHGFDAAMNGFTAHMHIPWLFALLAILAESIGPMALFIGFLSRIAAFGIFCEMIVAIWLVHWPHGFFMNWFGKQNGEGFEYHILVIAISVALLLGGGGKWSLDRLIGERLRTAR